MSSDSGPAITLDQLVALNDEIVALTRAGVPLSQGLGALAVDLPGRLGRTAIALGQRLERGETLIQAFTQMSSTFPPVYQAVIMAGLRSGSLSAALEGIASSSRRVAQVRRTTIISMTYPLIVLLVASIVLWFSSRYTQPVVFTSYAAMNVEPPVWYQWLNWIAERTSVILNVAWVTIAALVVVWLIRSGRAMAVQGGRLGGLPTVRHLLRAARMATFAELLALLVEQNLPLHEAIRLAGGASGDAQLAGISRKLSERIQAGQGIERFPQGFPPLLGWLLCGGCGQSALVRTLRQAADSYRRQFDQLATWLGLYVPMLLSAAVGGVVALYYVLVVMAPFYNLLYQLRMAEV